LKRAMKRLKAATIVCLMSCLPALTPAQSQGSWTPSEQQKLNVHLATQQYFRLVERGDFPAAYAMLSKDMQHSISLERWSIRRAEFNARMGEVVERSIRNITWGQEPAGAIQGSVFAAVDHGGKFRQAEIHCGRLFWQQQADGSFKLLREMENGIDKKAQSQMTAEQLAAARKKIRC
jgi:Protein of unknown function (DUF4019)